MNANDLQYLIEHPEAVRTIDKVSLEQLTRNIPIFQQFIALLLSVHSFTKNQALNQN